MKNKSKISLQHETHRHVWLKFITVVFLFFGYFIFISLKYGLEMGFIIAWLTWSFFVLCTPIADAGFLIDFPLRLLFKIKMYVSEMFVWITAISLNMYVFWGHPELYQKTKMLSLFKHILDQPLPYWSIILFSAMGTFLSVKFGDELLDVFYHRDRKYYAKHHFKWKAISLIFIFLAIFGVYDFLLKQLGVDIPL